MEHQTEHFGTVPPDQVPEAYAAEPLFGPTSEMAGESAGDPAAGADGELTLDADGDQMAADADDEPAFDLDGDPAVEAGEDVAPDADDGRDAAHSLWAGLDDNLDADGELGIGADDQAGEAAENLTTDRADELTVTPDDELASIAAKRDATGEPRVDAALARLDDLAGLPVTEHRAVFEDVHRRLRDVLGELDTGQPPDAGPAGAESRRGR